MSSVDKSFQRWVKSQCQGQAEFDLARSIHECREAGIPRHKIRNIFAKELAKQEGGQPGNG